MDLVKTLIRSVMRAFYGTRHILIIDALVLHSALRDDDLSYLIKISNTKELRELCAKLRADRFLAMHIRPELKEGMQRPINRTYYYIDYRQAIDAIKWRVYTVDKDIQGTAAPVSEKKEYFCPFCKAEWTMMEVLDSQVGQEGLLCHRCGTTLIHDMERNATGHEQSTRLNSQLKFITELLPRIDDIHVPDNTFDVAYSHRRHVIRDASHPGQESVPVELTRFRPTAVRGLANTAPATMSVNISASNGPSAAERAAESARKDKLALQNALPSWMSNSTVTGESFSGDPTTIPSAEKKQPDANDMGDHSFNQKDHEEIDHYFARLKQEAAEEAKKATQDGGESGSDEEDEFAEDGFEDVVGLQNQSGTTEDVAKQVSSPPVQEPKKVRVEEADGDGQQAKESSRDGGESEDDIEFEDV